MGRIGIVLSLIVALNGLFGVRVERLNVSAQEGTPGGSPSAATETLVSIAVDASLLTVPDGEAYLGRSGAEPGWSHTLSFPTTGVVIVYVVSGSYTLHSDGPVVLFRASVAGTPVAAEMVALGQEVTAQTGEAVVFLSSSRNEERNEGTTRGEWYSLVVAGLGDPTIVDEVGTSDGEFLNYIALDDWQPPASGPVTITFSLLDATASDPVPAAGVMQMIGDLTVPSPGRLVVTFSPSALPGASAVEFTVDRSATPTA